MHTHRPLVRNSSGKPESVLSISADITEQKKLEEQFLRAQRMESIGALAGGIAHDLNNIFAPILMAAEMLAGAIKKEGRKKAPSIPSGSVHRGPEKGRRILSFPPGNRRRETTL